MKEQICYLCNKVKHDLILYGLDTRWVYVCDVCYEEEEEIK